MYTKINSYQDYSKATIWDKLAFVATAKHNDKHIVKMETVRYHETLTSNKLVFSMEVR